MKTEVTSRREYKSISIKLASPDQILEMSKGEVTKPETVNYRSLKPEPNGLFCEKIFGPTRDWECGCGKYKRIRYKGIVCDKCGVEVTRKQVRRERVGHIHLAVPIVHIWFLRSQPSKISGVLGMSVKDIENIAYYTSYVVVQPGPTGTVTKDLLTEEQYLDILDSLPEGNSELLDEDPEKFVALTGGEAIKELLRREDPNKTYLELKEQIKTETSQTNKDKIFKRLRVLDAFRRSGEKGEGLKNEPSWMVLDVIPVIPPDLRPLVPLDGGRFATSDLNDLYRRVIIRNNRLKKLMDIEAPEVILRNEKRMLQEAIDSLFDNNRRAGGKSEMNTVARPLKSLADNLKGKQGRFRQNLLGKRVDYSGRSVIVVGPELNIDECGLPKDIAIELYKPFIIRRLQERGYVRTTKAAKRMIERKQNEVYDVLENVIEGHPVLLNRAPTLHRLGIQAFQPRLIEGKAIQLHPLVCTAFNADFDGDQMAVHLPISYEAQLEAMLLMLAPNNIMHTQNGDPIAVPSQDMVLGTYYLTKERPGVKGEGKVFASRDELLVAYNLGNVDLQAKIKVRLDGVMRETTTGRVIFNEIVPKEMGYINEVLDKSKLKGNVGKCFRKAGLATTVAFLDSVKNIGFRFATKGGLSVNIGDIVVPSNKEDVITAAQKEVDNAEAAFAMGLASPRERYNKIIDIWTKATNDVANKLDKELKEANSGFNSFWMMMESKARGSKEQLRQVGGMRGLMAKPGKTSKDTSSGDLIENPIKSNFKEGLSILEYFISTHGARKGLTDTALKTADAGYLTRKLHDVAQDVIITQEDCGTLNFLPMKAIKEADGVSIKVKLSDRVVGRIAAEDVKDRHTGDLIVRTGEMITEEYTDAIDNADLEIIRVRSVLTCEASHGVCAKCYGRNLATGKITDVGEAVGTIASQSIGEPGTQLTLRVFHAGGAGSLSSIQSDIKAKYEGKVVFENIRTTQRETEDGQDIIFVTSQNGSLRIENEKGEEIIKYKVPRASILSVKNGEKVEAGKMLCKWDPYNDAVIPEVFGSTHFVDFINNLTCKILADTQGQEFFEIIDSRDRTKSPAISIVDSNGLVLKSYDIPTQSQVKIENGTQINYVIDAKSTDSIETLMSKISIAKVPRDIGRARDITGGLPRVTELFEARSPQNAAIVSDIDGYVSFGKPKRNQKVVVVTSRDGLTTREYVIPNGRYLLVTESDFVHAGDGITQGPINPHDILRIKGVNAVQEYLVNEIQDVYLMQGVKINDKHIEVIARQMLQKVKITDPGDSLMIEGGNVDKLRLQREAQELKKMVVVTNKGDSKFDENDLYLRTKVTEANKKLKQDGKKLAMTRPAEPALSEPILLGISQAAISTESWLSAASFQETTKVLSEAAIASRTDELVGLKENIITGQLIPAGTGLRTYQNMLIKSKKGNIFGHKFIEEVEAVKKERDSIFRGDDDVEEEIMKDMAEVAVQSEIENMNTLSEE